MVLKLYGNLASPPARAVHMTIKHLNIPVEIVKLDLAKGELKGEEYMKINPHGTMPCFEDDGFILLDSHAINIYLATKYPQGEKLYPADPKKRAIVNERLFFESGELFGALKVQFMKLYRNTLKEIDEEVVLSFEKGYGGLETYLKNGKFVAGDSLTIADFSVIATLNHMKLLVPADKEKFPLVNAYIERATSWPFYEEIIEAGFNEYQELLKARNMQLPTMK